MRTAQLAGARFRHASLQRVARSRKRLRVKRPKANLGGCKLQATNLEDSESCLFTEYRYNYAVS